jgi:hypothetical protein
MSNVHQNEWENWTGKGEGRKQETANRVNELVDLVEAHTRTERHLEQHSDIASPEQVEHAEKVQDEREEQISKLKSKIVYGDGGPTDEVENLEKNITFAEGYMDHNADHMNKKDLENLKDKEENRRDTLNRLK